MFNLESMIAGLLNRYKSTQLFAVIVTIFMAIMGGVEFAMANHYITEGSFGGIMARVLQVFVFIKGILMQMDLPAKKSMNKNPVLDNVVWIALLVGGAFVIRFFYLKLFCAGCVVTDLTITTFALASSLVLLVAILLVHVTKSVFEI